MSPRRVLIVDDNEDSASSLAMLMELKGHAVRHATSGAEVIAWASDFGPDVVILDLGMPGMDGFATARELRKRLGPEGLLMIALTGWSNEEMARQSREAGFDHYLTKPVDTEALDRLLASPAAPGRRPLLRGGEATDVG